MLLHSRWSAYIWFQEYGKKQYSAHMCTCAPRSLFVSYILILKMDHISLERTGKMCLWSTIRRRGIANVERMRNFVLLCFHQVSIYSKWISSHPACSSSETGSRVYQQSASWGRTKGMNKHAYVSTCFFFSRRIIIKIIIIIFIFENFPLKCNQQIWKEN